MQLIDVGIKGRQGGGGGASMWYRHWWQQAIFRLPFLVVCFHKWSKRPYVLAIGVMPINLCDVLPFPQSTGLVRVLQPRFLRYPCRHPAHPPPYV